MQKRKIAGTVILLFGLALCVRPDMANLIKNIETEMIRQSLTEQTESVNAQPESIGNAGSGAETSCHPDTEDTLQEQYREIGQYNENLCETEQVGLNDRESYEQVPVDETLWEETPFGTIEIPKMNVDLPLYLGASSEHLAEGAAVLGQTSVPIGGSDTNSVIAGHRGWKDGDYFLNIEYLETGDLVYVTNPWETLTYQVTGTDIIDPDETQKLLIRDGKDMITLITCHPYGSHGKYRYVVYCERSEGSISCEKNKVSGGNMPLISELSGIGEWSLPEWTERIRRITAMLIIFVLILAITGAKRKERKERGSKNK